MPSMMSRRWFGDLDSNEQEYAADFHVAQLSDPDEAEYPVSEEYHVNETRASRIRGMVNEHIKRQDKLERGQAKTPVTVVEAWTYLGYPMLLTWCDESQRWGFQVWSCSGGIIAESLRFNDPDDAVRRAEEIVNTSN